MTDTIQQILDWHRAACPNPDNKAISVQIGCHYEEVAEMMEALGRIPDDVGVMAKYYKARSCTFAHYKVNELALLDSLCDQIVTALGVGYRCGFDMAGALAEVARSNDSKMVDGTFQYDANGKVMRPDSCSPPNLQSFIRVSEG